MGFYIAPKNAIIAQNIHAHQRSGAGGSAYELEGGHNVILKENIVYDWEPPNAPWDVAAISTYNNPSNFQFLNNKLIMPNGLTYFHDGGFPSPRSYSNNKYYVSNANAFANVNSYISFNTFKNQAPEPTASLLSSISAAGFPNPQYDIVSYMNRLRTQNQIPGITNYAATLDGFISAVIGIQDRSSFRSELTAPAVNCFIQREAFDLRDSSGAPVNSLIPGTPTCGSQTALPEIRVEVLDATASEVNPIQNTGKIRIHRSGPTSTELNVIISLSGSALSGVDYQTLVLSRLIPSGSSNVDVDVIAIADSIAEGVEQVRISLAPNALYTIQSTNSSGTIAIADANSCLADIDLNGRPNANDYIAFLAYYSQGSSRADLNLDGRVNASDFQAMTNAFAAGCI